MKYPKESLPKRPTHRIADKKYGCFQAEKEVFRDVAAELGLIPTATTRDDLSFSRHPLTFLVEAADDICYTLIDFEDGINLGLIGEEYALEYLINLVRDSINTKKYNALTSREDRLAYLRALSISTLINDAVRIFLENEEAILAGEFHVSLLEQSRFRAQIDDIIKISVSHIYQSQEVVQKEIAGYRILNTLLDIFCGAVMRDFEGRATNYDKLILDMLPARFREAENAYGKLLRVSQFVAGLTDGNALLIFNKINGQSLS